jgi:cell division protease FtsH
MSYFSPTEVRKTKEASLSDIVSAVNAGQVDKIEVSGDTKVTAIMKDAAAVALVAQKETGTSVYDYGITAEKTKVEIKNSAVGDVLVALAINLIPIALFIFFMLLIFRSQNQQNRNAMSFGQARTKLSNESGVKFKDVAGLKEAKVELTEIVEFLRNPKKFTDIGAEIPKGVLLTGPPGTGKTLLAKAVAGEASVPFFSISASEFVEMFVGVGASRVRDLFVQAKKASPAIIFIDELDAIGRQRGSGLGGSHDEREQTLNQILVEMDGFGTDTHVIILAATNRSDILDPALMRPGRFDRRVVVDLPARSERVEILQLHTATKPLDKDVNVEKVAAQTAGFSGADLKNVANEAAILTARDSRKSITQHDFDEAIEKVLVGPERRARVLNDEEKRVTAVHEAGHAIIGHALPLCDPIHKISIISRGMALGLTWSLPTEDRHLTSRTKFVQEIAMMLGGRTAEQQEIGEITTGASNDLDRATNTARAMVTQYGMSDKLGWRTFGRREDMIFLGREIHEERNYSDKVAELIDNEVDTIIDEAQKIAAQILKKHAGSLQKLTDQLLKEENVPGSRLNELIPLKNKQEPSE